MAGAAVRVDPVPAGDTDQVSFGRGTYAARSSMIASGALRMAADLIIGKARPMAAFLLEAAEADLVFADGSFHISGTDRSVALTEIARASYRPRGNPAHLGAGLEASAVYSSDGQNHPNGCHVCEVLVDPETGVVSIDRYAVVDDLGRVINPLICEGQIHGGVAQGAGQALMEQIVYDPESAQLLSGTFVDYCMPRADDFPDSPWVSRRSRARPIRWASRAWARPALFRRRLPSSRRSWMRCGRWACAISPCRRRRSASGRASAKRAAICPDQTRVDVMARKKLVILVAPTGGNAMDREGAHVPISPEEIADEALRCREAGASVVHIHARDPKTRQASGDPAIFSDIIRRIRGRCDMLIQTTTGIGITGQEVRPGNDERLGLLSIEPKQDLATIPPGSWDIWRPGGSTAYKPDATYHNTPAFLRRNIAAIVARDCRGRWKSRTRVS